MKSKSSLVLIEQLLMLLVFAICAAVCLSVFNYANQVSAQNQMKIQAIQHTQNIAERIQGFDQDILNDKEKLAKELNAYATTDTVMLYYDYAWQTVDKPAAVYTLQIKEMLGSKDNLGQISMTMLHIAEDKIIFEIPIAWQKEVEDE